jgi:hypothetical protein
MAEEKEKKTLEMRVAELEDKIAQLHISESDMATYQRVAARLGTSGMGAQMGAQPCVAAHSCVQCISPILQQCIQCTIRPIIRPIYWADCIQQCFAGGGGVGGAGFGGLGG